jgi:succinyl-diaminopimelate desuccinylase
MTVTDFIDARVDEIHAFASHLVQQPSPNPPGDTRPVADAVRALLGRYGIEAATIADQEHTPNLVATIGGTAPGPHLVLNGHMDVYPDGDTAQWTRPARSGEIADGRLHGRGAGDMKSGLTTILYAFLALAERGDLRGRLSVCAVSDEMSFSPHGAPLVLAERPDLVGDASIGAEPTSPDFVLCGEKGMVWLEVRTAGDGGAAAFAPGLRSAIDTMGDVLRDLAAFRDWQVEMPAEVHAALAAGGTSGLPPEALTYADDAVLGVCTFSVGRIEGGRKINLVADECRAEVDLRLPPGLTLAKVRAFVAEVIGRHPGASSTEIQAMEPNWTDPADPLVAALLDAGEQVLGTRPRPEFGITASDTRLWREHGRPAAMIGARIHGQGLPNESIAVTDLVGCAKVIALAAERYLTA